MKLAALAPDGRAALVVGAHVVPLSAGGRFGTAFDPRLTPRDVLADAATCDAARRFAARLEEAGDEGRAAFATPPRLLAPVRPQTLICAGNNYRRHAKEMNTPLPSRPGGFLKSPGTVIGPGAEIVLPPDPDVAASVDYEGELCVVIGRPAHRVAERDALAYVGGYTIGNDVSARNDVRGMFAWLRDPTATRIEAFSTPQDLVILGKQYPTFMPLGPVVTTSDELPDPHALRITTRVDGELRQDESTGDLVFGVAASVAYWSRFYALQPGDVISTGSPSGVGISFTPPRLLKPGSRVEVEIGGIGVLANPVVASAG